MPSSAEPAASTHVQIMIRHHYMPRVVDEVPASVRRQSRLTGSIRRKQGQSKALRDSERSGQDLKGSRIKEKSGDWSAEMRQKSVLNC